MGGIMSRVEEECEEKAKKSKGKKGKRKRGSDAKESPSKKVAKLDTPKFVYDTLFVKVRNVAFQGEDSDVIICALEHQWPLHKLYLKQSKYFEALLDGEWKDSRDSVFELDIPDTNITVEGLHAVLGSLYNNEITTEDEQLKSIIAAASFLQLDCVLDRVTTAMMNNLNDGNVIRNLDCSHTYGLKKALAASFEYLKMNFWRLSKKSTKFLHELPEEAMASLMGAHDLFALESEYDLYRTVKAWIYLQQMGCSKDQPLESIKEDIDGFFKNVRNAWNPPCPSMMPPEGTVVHPVKEGEEYESPSSPDSPDSISFSAGEFLMGKGDGTIDLLEPESIFKRYSSLFAGLRLNDIINSTSGIKALREDGIVPEVILKEVMSDSFYLMLENDERRAALTDHGYYNDITEEQYQIGCARYGREITTEVKSWRWMGYRNGIELTFKIEKGRVTMKRSMHDTKYAVWSDTRLPICFRFAIVGVEGKVIFDTGRKCHSMLRDVPYVINHFGEDELPPSFSVHFFVLCGRPSTPSSVHVRRWLSIRAPGGLKEDRPRLSFDSDMDDFSREDSLETASSDARSPPSSDSS